MQQNKVKLNQRVLLGLQSKNEQENQKAINKLFSSGKPEYLPHAIKLFKETEHPEIKKQLHQLLSELKHNDCVPYLIEAIIDDKNISIRKILVEVCWQNGLKYAQYLPIFVDLIISEDDLIAFEAFTVIENLEYLPSEEIISEQITKANQNMDKISETKQYFLKETIKFLKKA